MSVTDSLCYFASVFSIALAVGGAVYYFLKTQK